MAGRWKQDQAMLNKPVGSFSSALVCFEVLRFNRKDERKASKEYEGIEGDLIYIYIKVKAQTLRRTAQDPSQLKKEY